MRIELSAFCFLLVMFFAIPVAYLRTKTYSLGYDIGHLKQEEKRLIKENEQLRSQKSLLVAGAYQRNSAKMKGVPSTQVFFYDKKDSGQVVFSEAHSTVETAPHP